MDMPNFLANFSLQMGLPYYKCVLSPTDQTDGKMQREPRYLLLSPGISV
jgi:hypothetical protein